jgi:hypothetical protein
VAIEVVIVSVACSIVIVVGANVVVLSVSLVVDDGGSAIVTDFCAVVITFTGVGAVGVVVAGTGGVKVDVAVLYDEDMGLVEVNVSAVGSLFIAYVDAILFIGSSVHAPVAVAVKY